MNGDDFYYGFLNQAVQKNLVVKTNNVNIKTGCNIYSSMSTMNTDQVRLQYTTSYQGPISTGPWNFGYDRSKYAVAYLPDKEQKTVCITDLDRINSKRGGLAVCFGEPATSTPPTTGGQDVASKVAKIFYKGIKEGRQCK